MMGRSRQAEYQAGKRARAKAAGLCRDCMKRAALPGSVRCRECGKAHADAEHGRRARAKGDAP